MLAGPAVFDLTRLVTRLKHASPTGIDRVDLAYARRLLWPGDASPRFGLVSTSFGPRLLSGGAARAIVKLVAANWARGGIDDETGDEIAEETSGAEDDGSDATGFATHGPVGPDLDADEPVLRALAERLERPGPNPASRIHAGGRRSRQGIDDSWRRRRGQARTALRIAAALPLSALPRGAYYVHTSHLRLERPKRFAWLGLAERALRPVFFVHDLIPIQYPEYGRPGETVRHFGRMRTVALHAHAVVVNSADVGLRFDAHLAATGMPARPVIVGPLGVEDAFIRSAAAAEAPLRPARPTFIACGTIEPRKNVLFLLHLWRELAERLGPETPTLVIVGRRGWESENVVDMLERCPAIREHVVEVAGLPTEGLVRLMRGATALLMPSFAEGYGLPVVEAATVGLPVVASDIPVHREIAGGFARFIDPLDGPAWIAAIRALAAPDSPLRADLAARLVGYRPPTWPDHFARVEAALAELAARAARRGS